MKCSLFSFLSAVFLSQAVLAQTLFVSDVDDTIKLANVHSYKDMVTYALDEKSRFMGMSDLYNLVVQDNSDIKMVYLSKAPTWIMQGRHQSFLKNGRFPQGQYIGRSEFSGDVHKLESLRKLVREVRPRKVILIGDNGEADPQVYTQIAQEFRSEGILFFQFIRVVYSKNILNLDPGGMPLAYEQTGIVTPIEIALELESNGLLTTSSVKKLIATKGPDLVNEKLKEKNAEYAFPYFVECSDFRWKWDSRLSEFPGLDAIKKRIAKRCNLTL
jgi:hypothetical protein